MLRYVFILLISGFMLSAQAQIVDPADIQPDSSNFENIYVKKISEDSLHSSFLIWVKSGVKSHYHAYHTEHVYILEGEGTMTLGDSTFKIKAGDLIIIPMGTPHSVITESSTPLKVLSIQSPKFEGDRSG